MGMKQSLVIVVTKVPTMSNLKAILPIQYVYWLEQSEVDHGNDKQN